MFKKIRVLLLLLVLLVVSVDSYLSRSRSMDWQDELWVVIYPINADGSAESGRYIAQLRTDDFADIEHFFQREAVKYALPVEKPIKVLLAPEQPSMPPEVPENPSIVDSVVWSLQMRYWSWRYENWDGPNPDIRIYLNLFSPSYPHALRHSLGLQKGLIGLVNGFADERQQGQNNIIAAHELLHTVGASDKYDPATNFAIWPDGYAEPTKVPRFPQRKAEIMAGRLQVSPSIAVLPPDLTHVTIGAATAIEINWLRAPN
ncbi:hypothetical protein [Neptunomonas marina]|uniref:Uncharacterized protein n=1 Tax=Neptunomonas marina TaxID=1815562 RepID=A0A437QDF4_9GAMM|nr:hypothetical protein [Neptunomonas marina]RVU32572.1 hypothetical protein EOE65_02660 [Neptunomonas marina]